MGIEQGQAILDKVIAIAKERGPRFPRVWLDAARLDHDVDYLLKGIFERGKLIVVYGPSGDGKTFFVLDIAGHLAVGRDWRGRRVRQCLIAYVAAEAGASIMVRFIAWREHRLSEAREERIPLTIITRAVNLLNPIEVEALILELRAISTEAGMPVGMVIFDTFSRSTPGGNENAAEDMTRAIGAADLIRDELGAATCFIHHSGKDAAKGARGHSSLFAAADTVISVIERVATVEKSRDGTQGEQFPFGLEVVNLGEDKDGDTITTCLVVPTQAAPQARKQKPLSGVAKVALDALTEAIGEHGRVMPGTSTIPPNVKVVTLDQWRSRFTLRYGSDPEDRGSSAVRKAFMRGREALLKASAISISDPYVWASGYAGQDRTCL